MIASKPSNSDVKDGLVETTDVYQYLDRHGRPWFQRFKIKVVENIDGHSAVLRKDFYPRHDHPWWVPDDGCNWRDGRGDHWHWTAPAGWKGALYAPMAPGPGRFMYVVEGEKDVNSLVARGHWAATHPNGAEVGPNIINARKVIKAWMSQRGHRSRPIIIVMDRDEAGAYNAWQWYTLLVDAMEDHGPIEDLDTRPRIVRACGPVDRFKDVTDHLESGQGVDRLIPITVAELHEWARPKIEKRERANRARAERNRWKSPAERFDDWAESNSPTRKGDSHWTGYKPGRRVGV